MQNTIYSASEGPMIPKTYMIQKAPIYPPVLEPPQPQVPAPQPEMETKYVVHFLPIQTEITTSIPVQQPITSTVQLQSTEVVPVEPVNVVENPMTYSTLQNIIPRLDELDTMKINKDFDFNCILLVIGC